LGGRRAAAPDQVRERYLRYLHADVENRLQSSIHGARFFDLGLSEAPGATVPWHYVYRDPGSRQEVFESFESAFERFDGRLLLLGSPGSGKTTTLLIVARRLIAEARRDPSAPVPVLLNLASFGAIEEPNLWFSWLPGLRSRARAFDEKSFEPWLSEQLARLPVRGLAAAAAHWFDDGRVALLLDGLDEVQERRAERLVRTLNTSFLHRYADLPTVISSRVLEYQRLTADRELQLRLNGAVTLQPLDRDQIHAYLTTAGAGALRDALAHDRDLYELAQTPLTLSLMTLTYGGLAPEALPPDLSLIERRRHLFDTYVERMLQRTARRVAGKPFDLDPAADEPTRYNLSQVNRFLGWLAVQLSERMQMGFAPGDLVSLLAQDVAGPSTAVFTELWTARLLFVILLSTAVSAFFVARSPFGWLPWLMTLAGPASFLGARGLGRLTAKRSRRDKVTIKKTLTALSLAFLLAGYFSLLFYLAMIALVRLLPFEVSWLSLSALAVVATGGSTIWLSANPEERRTIRRYVVVGGLLGGGLALLLCQGSVGARLWLMLAIFSCPYGVYVAKLVHSPDFVRERTRSGARILLELVALFLSLAWFLLILAYAAGVGWIGDRLIGRSIPGWTVIVIGAWIGLAGEISGEGNVDANLEAALGAILGLFLRGPAGALAGTYLLPYVGRFFVGAARRWTTQFFLQPLLVAVLGARGCTSWRPSGFVRFAAEALLLRKAGEEYEFMHRLLRDHFALRELVPLLYNEPYKTRIEAVQQIAARGESSLDVLGELALHSDPAIRQAAVTGLGTLQLPRVTLLFGKLLTGETDPNVSAQVAKCLAEQPRKETDAFLRETLKEEVVSIRSALVAVLAARGKGGSEFLQEAMADQDPVLAKAAARMYIAFLAMKGPEHEG
jgi:DNA polymerase III delta prime subunit